MGYTMKHLLFCILIGIVSCVPEHKTGEKFELITSDREDNFAAINGADLYQVNCASCHGNIEASTRRGSSAESISQAILTIPNMGHLKQLTSLEISAIAIELKDVSPVLTTETPVPAPVPAPAPVPEPKPVVTNLGVSKIDLYDVSNKRNITSLSDNQIVEYAKTSLAFVVEGEAAVESVRIQIFKSSDLSKPAYEIVESGVPYVYPGDSGGVPFGMDLPFGAYQIKVTPYSENKLGGDKGVVKIINFKLQEKGIVEAPTPTPTPAPAPVPEPVPAPTPAPEPSANSEFELLNVTGSNSDLVEGTFTPSSKATLANSGTQSKRSIHQGGFGTNSVCGLRGRVIKVTNLNDSGPGSLRDAVSKTEARTIVFEVSGAIKLRSRLDVNSPFLTIAGQTAPAPGISLYHHSLRINTHDVCLQHFRVRLGDRDHNLNLISSSQADQADALMIVGGRNPGGTHNVVLDNMSISWSLDESISMWGGISNVTIRDSIIAEPLRKSVHKNENHAYCLLIRSESERISLIGNLFGHCQRRSPRMDGGTLQYVNNLVYNPGEYAVHVHDLPIDVTMVGNIIDFPSDPNNRWEHGGAKEFFASRSTDSKVYFLGNRTFENRPLHAARMQGDPVVIQSVPRVWEGNVKALTAAEVQKSTPDWVGAFPRYRDVVDTRIIKGVRTRTGTYLDSQMMVNGGYVYIEENRRALTVPKDPQKDDDGDGISNLVEWLQFYTDLVE